MHQNYYQKPDFPSKCLKSRENFHKKSTTNIFVVEGYLFEVADSIKPITQACKDAHNHGALVAMTVLDVSYIKRHYDDFWKLIGNYANIVFTNSDEARALCNFSLKNTQYL